MSKKLENLDKALEILYDYKGENPYIHIIKHEVYIEKKENSITDFKINFIIHNKDVKPVAINKITKIPEWYGEDRKKAWKLDFTPTVLKIVAYLGEEDGYYCCYVKYRQSIDPVMCFIPKKAVINNFKYGDYHNKEINFDRYDNLSTSIDKNRKLRAHQKDAVKFLLDRKRCILADDMGLGKTTELAVAAIEGNFDSVLIITPANLKSTWKKELMWYVPEKDITVVDNITGKNKKELEELLGYGIGKSGKTREELSFEAKEKGKWQDNRFVIVNYDILDEFFVFTKARKEELIRKAIDESPILKYIYNRKSCLIVDEAHKLSNNKSIRYKVIQNIINKGNPECVFLTTGTPITNNPLNLFFILSLIKVDITLDVEYFKNRYCNAKKVYMRGEYDKWKSIWLRNNGYQKDSKPNGKDYDAMRDYIDKYARKINIAKGAENLDELREIISPIYLRRVKEDIGDLPNKNIHEVYYHLNGHQESEYNRLWDEYIKAQSEESQEKELNKDLLEGGLYRKYLSNEMVPNTIELCNKILETENKVIIATCYDEELNKLKEYYGENAVVYNGKLTPRQKEKNKEEFINNPDIRVLIGNIEACGVGLTLTVCKSMIFNNMSFVAGDNRQMEDRIHRIGQTRDVDIYYQIFENTQYHHMWKIVLRKQLISDKVIKKESEK